MTDAKYALIQSYDELAPSLGVAADGQGADYVYLPQAEPYLGDRIQILAENSETPPANTDDWLRLASGNLVNSTVISVQSSSSRADAAQQVQQELVRGQGLVKNLPWKTDAELAAAADSAPPIDPDQPHQWMPFSLSEPDCAFCEMALLAPIHKVDADTIPQTDP